MSSAKRTILKGPDDWDAWIKELESRVPPQLCDHIFSEDASRELMACPVRPQYSDLAPTATKYVDLSPAQQRIWDAAIRDYDFHMKEFENETKLIKQARDAITESVSSAKAQMLENKDSLRHWIKLLEQSTAPSEGYMIEKVRTQYDEIIKSLRGERLQSQWLDKWEAVMQAGIKYKLPEMRGSQWLRDIALLTRPIDDNYASEFIKQAQRYDDKEVISRQQGRMAIAQLATVTTQINHLNALVNKSNQIPGQSPVNEAIAQSISQIAAQLNASAVLPDPDGPDHDTYIETAFKLRELVTQSKPEFSVPMKRKWPPAEGSKEELFSPQRIKKRFEGHPREGSDKGLHFDRYPDDRHESRYYEDKHFHNSKASARSHDGKPEMHNQCVACGMRGHEVTRCWYLFEDRKPEGKPLSEWRVQKANGTVEADRSLKKRIDTLRIKRQNGKVKRENEV